jgi:hypothetical protein
MMGFSLVPASPAGIMGSLLYKSMPCDDDDDDV